MKDSLKTIGKVRIQHWNESMELLSDTTQDNLVVTSGLEWIAGRLTASPPAVMGYMGVGTDNTAPSAGQTALVSEVGRAAMTVSGGTASGQNVEYTATLGAGVGTGALVEAGIFQSSTGSTMLSRVIYSVVNKAAGDTVAITWTVSSQ